MAVLQTKQNRFEEQKTDLNIEKTQLNTTISDLRTSLSNPTSVSYWDENSQSVITTTSSSTRRALQSELKLTIADRDTVNVKIEAVMDSIMRIDSELLDLEIGNEEQRELGPLKYLSETTGKPMGQVVNWFLLLIIFVFDPLAIALVVAANFAFAQIRKPTDDSPDVIPHHTPQPIMPTSNVIYESDLDDDIIVTPEQEEKIKWENNLDDEGEVIDELSKVKNQPNIYGEYTTAQLYELCNRLPRSLCGRCYNFINEGKPEKAIEILKQKKII